MVTDHGKGSGGYSEGKYTISKDGKSITYHDEPNIAVLLIPSAQKLLSKSPGKNWKGAGGKMYEICNIRIVQRFITTAYIKDKAVRSYHWTSTYDAAWGFKPGLENATASIVGRHSPDKSPTDIDKEYAASANRGD